MSNVHAHTFNAITAALSEAGRFVPLSVREAVAAAVEAAVEPEIRADEREYVARQILAQKTGCAEHPMPLPKPSCWTCARDGAFHRSARIAMGEEVAGGR